TAAGWRRSAGPGRATTAPPGPGSPAPRPAAARRPSAACGIRAAWAGTGTGAPAGRSTAAASGAPTGRPAAPGPPPGRRVPHRTASSAGQAGAGQKESHDRRSARTVPSGGLPDLQSRATMDALLPYPGQPDTPHQPELGITHLGPPGAVQVASAAVTRVLFGAFKGAPGGPGERR